MSPTQRARRQLILPLLLIGVLIAAGSQAAAHRFRAARHSRQLRLATARLYEEGCKQREVLLAGIEAYRRAVGTYPPDHVICEEPLAVDPITNQLLYELVGTLYDPTNGVFSIPKLLSIPAPLVRKYFRTDSFKNTATEPARPQHFLDLAKVSIFPVNTSRERVGLVGLWPTWEDMEPELYRHFRFGSWRYNSSSPSHNPGGFDLWLEINTTQTNLLIKNW